MRRATRSASLLGVEAGDVLFTGGATEANNTALLGLLRPRREVGHHIVTTAVEHPSVEAPLEALEAEGWRVTRVPVDVEGRVEAKAVGDAFEPDTVLATLIWANNETGVLQPIAEVAELARKRGVLMHSDATQAVGKLPVDLRDLPVDLLSLSAHKFGGPKGVGCLVVRGDLVFEPVLRGGPQERRRRGGTENVAGIAGLGLACELAQREVEERGREYGRLRDRLWRGIEAAIPRVRRNGSRDLRLAQYTQYRVRRHRRRSTSAGSGPRGHRGLRGRRLRVWVPSLPRRCSSPWAGPPNRRGGPCAFPSATASTRSRSTTSLELLPSLVERVRNAGLP